MSQDNFDSSNMNPLDRSRVPQTYATKDADDARIKSIASHSIMRCVPSHPPVFAVMKLKINPLYMLTILMHQMAPE